MRFPQKVEFRVGTSGWGQDVWVAAERDSEPGPVHRVGGYAPGKTPLIFQFVKLPVLWRPVCILRVLTSPPSIPDRAATQLELSSPI